MIQQLHVEQAGGIAEVLCQMVVLLAGADVSRRMVMAKYNACCKGVDRSFQDDTQVCRGLACPALTDFDFFDDKRRTVCQCDP